MLRWLLPLAFAALLPAQPDDHFETRVRPVLARQCYPCHAGEKQFSGLRVDSRDALIRGGKRGPALTPGHPEQSLLVNAIEHRDLAMPVGSKLAPAEIAAIKDWIQRGAPWPATTATAANTNTTASRYSRLVREHWAFQPLKSPRPPRPGHPVDAFLGPAPSPAAPRAVWLRRLSFILTGLPPTPADLARHETYDQAVDRLLASPHYGEQWARHWMDLVRYAETRGYEWNYEIAGAWRYRDYLIRAFNSDVPYNLFVKEHIAGDLLPQPRLNLAANINESVIGTAFFRLGEAGHDDCIQFREIALDVIDNQIDTLAKTFQGLTVACARCHDHKLDPIPTQDYYALYGILNSSRPVVRSIDAQPNPAPARLAREIRRELATLWQRDAASLAAKLAAKQFTATSELADLSTVWAELKKDPAAAAARYRAEAAQRERRWRADYEPFHDGWQGIPESPAGELALAAAGPTIATAVLPRGRYGRAADALRSPDLPKHRKYVSLRAFGGSLAARRAVIDNCAIGEQNKLLEGRVPRWTRTDTYSKEPRLPVFIELVTRWANPRYPDRPGVLKPEQELLLNAPHSYFGWAGAVLHDTDEAPPELLTHVLPVLDQGPGPAAAFTRTLTAAINKWAARQATDEDAVWLDWALQEGLLTNTADGHAPLEQLITQYRAALQETPRVVEGLADAGPGHDFPVLIAGGPKSFGAPAPRRLLHEIFQGPELGSGGSGRLALAEQIASPQNPLTARVMVNRLWHHVFGQGLVTSVDNFGTLGERPSHPELLDYLASRFIQDGWSVKKLLRLLVTSQHFRQTQRPLRRLSAEELRDAILQTSGELKLDLYGESIHPPRARAEEYRRLFSGPLDGHARRSLYTKITRMEGAAFLETFDYPAPLAGRGSRDVTNVPAQALTLLNDPFVLDQARRWAQRLLQQHPTAEPRLQAMFRTALGRPATAVDVERFRSLAAELASLHRENALTSEAVWKDVAHAVFNLKEFLYVP